MRAKWQHAPRQMLYQNNRLGCEICATTFIGVLSYHGDVNHKKLPLKTHSIVFIPVINTLVITITLQILHI